MISRNASRSSSRSRRRAGAAAIRSFAAVGRDDLAGGQRAPEVTVVGASGVLRDELLGVALQLVFAGGGERAEL